MGSDGMRELRSEPRLPAGVGAALLMYRKRYEVIIVDLSNSGAMVAGEGELPAAGDEVVLARDTFEVVATVAWSSGGKCGLRFHRAIDAAAVARRLKETARARAKH